jgi:hypothetical protein
MPYGRYRNSNRQPKAPKAPEQRIEFPSRGATYCTQEYGVYEYSTYGRGSVLAGQQRRVFLGSYLTEAEAKAAFPDATPAEGCGYRAPDLSHLPDDTDY